MSNADYPNSGALFKNDRKKSQNSPDYNGRIEIDRELVNDLVDQLQANPLATIYLSGWRKQGSRGDFISFKANAPMKKDQGNNSRGNQREVQSNNDLDDEIPF